MKIYDVSVLISEKLPTWPGNPTISMKLTESIARGDAANVTRLDLGVHTGTHMDAPIHFEPGGRSIDQIPVDVLIGPCRVFDLSQVPEKISRDVLAKLDLKGVKRVLFKTRNSRWWQDGDSQFHEDFVYVSDDGARALVERGIQLVGVDYLSVEQFGSKDHGTHHALLGGNIAVIEGLNLSGVPAGDYELIALPMKLKGADGAPTRVVLRELAR
jgi:arylformamidase